MTTHAPAPRETLAGRVRELMAQRQHVRELRMFGGQSFMVDERLAVAVRSNGDLLVHTDPSAYDDLIRRGGEPAYMGNGRLMGRGWLTAPFHRLGDEGELAYWSTPIH